MEEISSDSTTDLSFEEVLTHLEETVQTLDAGGLPLAKATLLYEKGMRLGRICIDMLASAELKISRIQTSYGEQMRMLDELESIQNEDQG